MFSHCPGQDGRNLNVEVFKCPGCGADVELFSDEMRFRCKKCGTMVARKEVAPSCLDWCDVAQKCLGEEKFSELNKPGAGDKNK